MTIEKLEARKLDLQTQQMQLIANTNAVNGALQDCDYWIEQLKAMANAPKPAEAQN